MVLLMEAWRPWEVSLQYIPLYIALMFFKMIGFFIGLQIRIWKTMWDVIVPAKLTAFGWRLCKAILHELFANGVQWFEFALQEIFSNEDFRWLLTVLWASWYVRNRNLLKPEKDRNEKEASLFIPERGQDHKPLTKPPSVSSARSRWIPPPMGLYKVNFNAAFDDNIKRGGIGVIIRDNEGFVWGGAAVKVDDVMEASAGEAMAAAKALEVAREMGCRRIILESDCFGILSNLSRKEIEQGKRAMGEFEECYVHPIGREGNRVANLIAGHSIVSEEDLYWRHDYPKFIHEAIMFDAINL